MLELKKNRDNHEFKGTMENFLREVALVAEQAFIRRKWMRVAGWAAISKDIQNMFGEYKFNLWLKHRIQAME